MEVTLTLSGFDHAKGLGMKLLPFLALGLASRLSGGGDNHGSADLLAVICLPCSQLGGGHVGGDGGAGHGLVCGGVAPCPLIMGYTLPVWQAPQWSVHKSSIQPHTRATASALMQRVELAPHQIPQRINHVIVAGLLVRVALLRVALQL